MAPPLGWRCIHCGKSGEISRAPADSCLITWPRILEAHTQATVDCDEKHGHSGIAIKTSDLPASSNGSLLP